VAPLTRRSISLSLIHTHQPPTRTRHALRDLPRRAGPGCRAVHGALLFPFFAQTLAAERIRAPPLTSLSLPPTRHTGRGPRRRQGPHHRRRRQENVQQDHPQAAPAGREGREEAGEEEALRGKRAKNLGGLGGGHSHMHLHVSPLS